MMSTLGKVCLVLTLLLLLVAVLPIPGVWGGWTPKLLVLHNQWSEKLRDARKKAGDAMLSHDQARLELRKATTDLESLMIGWDRFWIVPARGPNNPPAAPTIAKSNDGRLQLSNLGEDHGLKNRQITDDGGAQQTMAPVIHAFYAGAEGFTYAGEFVATDITQTSAVLQPVHSISLAEINSWPVNEMWRLRTLIPTASRLNVDELYRHGRRTGELTRQTEANILRQQKLLAAAQAAYNVRRAELLGDPAREDVLNRPEFKQGLLKVIEEVEEERNQRQLDLDALRRAIKASRAEQSDQLETLNRQVTSLPGAVSRFAKVPEEPAEAK